MEVGTSINLRLSFEVFKAVTIHILLVDDTP